MQMVKKALGGLGGVRVTSESPRIAAIEGLLARADRRMSKVLEDVRWDPRFPNFKKALARHGLSFDQENYRRRTSEEALPWGHIQASWPKDRLLKDAQRAQREKTREVRGVAPLPSLDLGVGRDRGLSTSSSGSRSD